MPVVGLIGAAATIGGAVISSNAQKDAASSAANAQAQASASQKALQDQAIATANQVNSPFLGTGFAALDALAAQYGLTSGASSASASIPTYAVADGRGVGFTSNGTPYQTGADPYAEYKAANPDLAAEAARVVGSDPRFPNEAAYFAWHDQQYAGEGRQSYTSQPQATSGTPEAPSTYTPPTITDAQAPTYQTSADVLSQLGGFRPLDISTDAFKNSGYYNLGLEEGLNAVNAGYNARGLLKSGAAIKGVEDFAQTNFAKNYGSFADTELARYNAEAAQFNADRSALLNQLNNENQFKFNAYTDERDYDTGVYNTNTDNLFKLAGIGQNAAGNITSAASSYAGNVGNIYQNNANAQADQAYSTASANTQLGNVVAGQVANLFNNGVKTSGNITPINQVSAYQPITGVSAPSVANLYRVPNVNF